MSDQDDLALLHAYEPILKYTQGELFFPAAIDGYVEGCDVWVGRSQRERHLIAGVGTVTPDRLSTFTSPPGETLFLRFVQEPLNGLEITRWQNRPDRPKFKAPGRLARVGLFARLVDAGFTASLLLRGSVPGGTAAAASNKYQAVVAKDPRTVYHGRVIRRDGWIVLQYLFFYFMNDYRSTFSGANDHESDWEQVFVVLDDAPDGPKPVWVGAAAHDYSGDDLRRRWDDPLLTLEGDHLVIFAGAGSHAAYFEQGEYVTTVPLPAAGPLTAFLEGLRSFWRDTLRQPDPGDLGAKLTDALSVPFVDYARGDGRVLGPGNGSEGQWTQILVGDDTDWVDGYRGLFGLDTHDRFAGERAPAGPKYTRSGAVRQSWHDPLGFLGLSKVAPPHMAVQVLEERITALSTERAGLEKEVEEKSEPLHGLGLEVMALSRDGAMASVYEHRNDELQKLSADVNQSRQRISELAAAEGATRIELKRLEAGTRDDPAAHLQHAMHPVPTQTTRYGFFVEFWAAISAGLILLVVAGLYITKLTPAWVALIIALVAYALLEAAFRRRLTVILLRATLFLAIIAVVVLVIRFAPEVIVAGVVLLAFVVLTDNLRELRRR